MEGIQEKSAGIKTSQEVGNEIIAGFKEEIIENPKLSAEEYLIQNPDQAGNFIARWKYESAQSRRFGGAGVGTMPNWNNAQIRAELIRRMEKEMQE